jgi:ABC-type spermidine/putrescine transport system permease subunit II
MPDTVMNGYGIEHPAPQGGRVGFGSLFGGLLAPPIAWSLQLLVNFGLASYACFPREFPRLSSTPGWVWPTLVAINLVALAVSVVATAISYRNLRRTGEEASGGHGRLLEAGEGRTRFLAVWGIWTGVWFTFAIVFNTIGVLWVQRCGS